MLYEPTQLRLLRRHEAATVAPVLPPASRVLELGAGTGAQARYFAGLGHRVTAIDVAGSQYLDHAEYPVEVYDGRTLPFAAGEFDVVFSSNVLEHVVALDALLAETRRVLAAGGLAVHVVPTATWRWWTSLAHYPWLLTLRWRRPGGGGAAAASRRYTPLAKLRMALASPRHGELGTAASELYHFSRLRWRRQFRVAGFEIRQRFPNRLFYTGYSLFGARLGIAARARLARGLGSATMTWVLRSP